MNLNEGFGFIVDGTVTTTNTGGIILATSTRALTWLDHAQDCSENQRRLVCCWCRQQPVEENGQACIACSELPTCPFLDMKEDDNHVIFYKGVSFCNDSKAKAHRMPPEVALFYAHMRAERLQARVDALESTVKEMKQTLSDFIASCELTPDGPVAADIVERTFKMYKQSE